MEVVLIERITLPSYRQIRLHEVEAPHIKINMTEEQLLDAVNIALQIPFLERFTYVKVSVMGFSFLKLKPTKCLSK